MKKQVYIFMFLRFNNLFVTINSIHKKQKPSVIRQLVFIFNYYETVLLLSSITKKLTNYKLLRNCRSLIMKSRDFRIEEE